MLDLHLSDIFLDPVNPPPKKRSYKLHISNDSSNVYVNIVFLITQNLRHENPSHENGLSGQLVNSTVD